MSAQGGSTVFHCGIHYLVTSLAHLHLLFLKHIYISILRVCNQDTPYILAYATVVSIALEHKLFIGKKNYYRIAGKFGGQKIWRIARNPREN